MTFTTPTSRPEPDELDVVVRRLEAERHAPSRWWGRVPAEEPAWLQDARLAELTKVVNDLDWGGWR